MPRWARLTLAIVLLLAGVFTTIAGLAIVLLVGPDGSVSLPPTRLLGTGEAITLPQLDVPVIPGDTPVTLEVAAERSDTPLFLGIARSPDVDAYLRGVPIDVIQQIDWPGAARTEHVSGTASAAPPADQGIWAVSATGKAPSLRWEIPPGDWTLVLMREDAQSSIDVTVRGSVTIKPLGPIGFGVLAVGVLVLAGGVWVTIRAARYEPTPS